MARPLNPTNLAGVTVLSVAVGLALKAKFGSDWFEFAGFVTGVVAVYLVAVEHMINWPIGLANVSVSGYVFFTEKLYADMSLQAFFFALGVMGWWQWARGGEGKTPLTVSRISRTDWAWIAVILAGGTAAYYPLIAYFKGAQPFIDSLLTVTSIIAQILLNRKKLETWLLWIAVDTAYLPLYINSHLISMAVLYALFLVLAAYGLVDWRKSLFAQTGAPANLP